MNTKNVKPRCEAKSITQNRTPDPLEPNRCRDSGTLHAHGSVLCWTHATRYNEGRTVELIGVGERLAKHFEASP